ncbi:TRAP transporter small permease [Ancylobacter pratisalsi]|uniref:TRAP transporter small permease protein n=1 Tax=Ancylobacter pratisalsi TaxID=1745854 RepID=A0A6P1YN99_9HYPH|nr:TRAP transporter small permease [Ancylobacter pratisalsi]QIB34532.1 TRAP transporter small permease [Ancylobacter pratisalsi]
MKRIIWLIERGARAGAALGAAAILLMMVHVALDVVMRKLLGVPLPGTLAAVTNYYMVIAVFMPLALVERRRAHISVDVVMPLLSARLGRYMRATSGLAAALIMALVAWRGWTDAVRDWQVSASQVQGSAVMPVWPAHFAVPFGSGLLAIAFLLRLVPRPLTDTLPER